MIFKHKIVNDLAWVIGSVPLMSYNPKLEAYHRFTNNWFVEEVERCNGFLKQLDASPDKLYEFMHHDGRDLLGKRFERFVKFWLMESGRFDVILSNEPVRNGKITVGEVDFIVEERLTGNTWHIEVACKYYLGYNNSSLWKNWLGMNAQDALADKMTKFDKQLTIFNRAEGKELLQRLRIKTPSSFLLMKGYFFYHWKSMGKSKSPKLSTINHNTGLYVKEKELDEFFTGYNSWVVLSKKNWFAPFTASDDDNVLSEISVKSRVKELLDKYQFGVMLARLREEHGMMREDLRVAITLESWPEKN